MSSLAFITNLLSLALSLKKKKAFPVCSCLMPPSPASSAPMVQLLPFALSQDEGGVRFIGQGAWISYPCPQLNSLCPFWVHADLYALAICGGDWVFGLTEFASHPGLQGSICGWLPGARFHISPDPGHARCALFPTTRNRFLVCFT